MKRFQLNLKYIEKWLIYKTSKPSYKKSIEYIN